MKPYEVLGALLQATMKKVESGAFQAAPVEAMLAGVFLPVAIELRLQTEGADRHTMDSVVMCIKNDIEVLKSYRGNESAPYVEDGHFIFDASHPPLYTPAFILVHHFSMDLAQVRATRLTLPTTCPVYEIGGNHYCATKNEQPATGGSAFGFKWDWNQVASEYASAGGWTLWEAKGN